MDDRTILQQAVASPRQLAELRIKYAGCLADRLSFTAAVDIPLLSQIVSTDPTLAEEIVRHESFNNLKAQMQKDFITNDEDDDEILELWCSILAFQSQHPRSPFTPDELTTRLPLHFSFPNKNGVDILMHQVTDRQSAQSDVGFVVWPSAVVLSDFILRRQGHHNGSRILELGAGCGLAGLVAAVAFPTSQIILSDFNRTVLGNLERNVRLNELENCQVIGLDFSNLETTDTGSFFDMDGNPHEPVDLILGADIICQESDAHDIVNILHRLLRHKAEAWLVSATANHRFGVDQLVSATDRTPGLQVSVTDIETDAVSSLLEKTSGYVPGMKLQFFRIAKIEPEK